MGGPVPFGYAWIIITGAALVLTMFVIKPRTIVSAIACGLAFGTPIATLCWVLPTLDSQLDYFNESRAEAVATIIFSIILMVVATFHRQLNWPRIDDDKPADDETD